MQKSLFIGIDFSKKTFDVSVIHPNNLQTVDYQQFENSKEGCISLIKWIKTITDYPREQWLFCGEHTGLYSICLSEYLVKQDLYLWLENPLQIKQSSGIKRDKSDQVDSREIAFYAYRFQDRARVYQLPDKSLKSLELLLSYRERLLINKHHFLKQIVNFVHY